jgi:hypothetical protein
MYFPYLRGKQFELIAIRELAEMMSKSGKIIPIIEPVKEVSSFKKTFEALHQHNLEYCFILNARVGNMDPDQTLYFLSTFEKKGQSIYTFIIDNKTNITFMLEFIQNHLDFQHQRVAFIHKTPPVDPENFDKLITTIPAKYNLVDENFPRRYRRSIRNHYSGQNNNLVLLGDRFRIKERNSDYQENPDEFFSDDPFFYKEENYIGFSDFLTIGDEYSELGFTPHAVAFHLTYPKEEEIWVEHFVSDTIDDDAKKVAAKTHEAMKKAAEFIHDNNLNTEAAREIQQMAKDENYRGLGYLKKLSIKHHIELINQIMQ